MTVPHQVEREKEIPDEEIEGDTRIVIERIRSLALHLNKEAYERMVRSAGRSEFDADRMMHLLAASRSRENSPRELVDNPCSTTPGRTDIVPAREGAPLGTIEALGLGPGFSKTPTVGLTGLAEPFQQPLPTNLPSSVVQPRSPLAAAPPTRSVPPPPPTNTVPPPPATAVPPPPPAIPANRPTQHMRTLDEVSQHSEDSDYSSSSDENENPSPNAVAVRGDSGASEEPRQQSLVHPGDVDPARNLWNMLKESEDMLGSGGWGLPEAVRRPPSSAPPPAPAGTMPLALPSTLETTLVFPPSSSSCQGGFSGAGPGMYGRAGKGSAPLPMMGVSSTYYTADGGEVAFGTGEETAYTDRGKSSYGGGAAYGKNSTTHGGQFGGKNSYNEKNSSYGKTSSKSNQYQRTVRPYDDDFDRPQKPPVMVRAGAGLDLIIFRLSNIITELRVVRALERRNGENTAFFETELSGQHKCHDDLHGAVSPILSEARARILDGPQNELINRALCKERGLTLAQGPPGTGKTWAVSWLIACLAEVEDRILCCGPTNQSVLELADKYLNNEIVAERRTHSKWLLHPLETVEGVRKRVPVTDYSRELIVASPGKMDATAAANSRLQNLLVYNRALKLQEFFEEINECFREVQRWQKDGLNMMLSCCAEYVKSAKISTLIQQAGSAGTGGAATKKHGGGGEKISSEQITSEDICSLIDELKKFDAANPDQNGCCALVHPELKLAACKIVVAAKRLGEALRRKFNELTRRIYEARLEIESHVPQAPQNKQLAAIRAFLEGITRTVFRHAARVGEAGEPGRPGKGTPGSNSLAVVPAVAPGGKGRAKGGIIETAAPWAAGTTSNGFGNNGDGAPQVPARPYDPKDADSWALLDAWAYFADKVAAKASDPAKHKFDDPKRSDFREIVLEPDLDYQRLVRIYPDWHLADIMNAKRFDVGFGRRGRSGSKFDQMRNDLVLRLMLHEGKHLPGAWQRGGRDRDKPLTANQVIDKFQTVFLQDAKIVFCTVSVGGRSSLDHLSFPVVIVDEAGMVPEAETCIVINDRVRRVVLVGDPKQLQATVLDSQNKAAGYGRSLMERLMVGNDFPYHLLKVEYRMMCRDLGKNCGR